MLGSGTRSPNRNGKNKLRTKSSIQGNDLHNCNCTILSPSVQPRTTLGGGVFIPPTLLQYSRNAPPVTTNVKKLHQGYSVISPGKTVRIGHSYSSHMQHGAWQPSARTFGRLRDVLSLSFVTSMSPAESRRSRTSP